MILIADSGSTKTDWRFIDRDGNIHQVKTVGLNPYFTQKEDMAEAISEGPASLFAAEAVEQLYFYGSGLGNDAIQSNIKLVLAEFFINARIEVEHDLLAAARALCGRKAGIAMILGTGANTCVYDGSRITHNIKSTGYILGDEGSGADLGKRWLSACLNRRAPDPLVRQFFQAHGLNHETCIQRVYSGRQPNRFLASFAPFLSKHIKEAFVSQLVQDAFDELFERYILRYPPLSDQRLHASGSVAYYFSPILRAVAERHGVSMGTFIKDPIAALTLYHLEAL